MWLPLLLALAPSPPSDPVQDTLADGERWGDHLAVARLVAEGRIPAEDPRVVAIFALAEAEAALASGDQEVALGAAQRVPEGSALAPRARLIAAEVHVAAERLKSAAQALMVAVKAPELRDQALIEIAGIYEHVEREDQASNWLAYVSQTSPWFATALAHNAALLSYSDRRDDLRVGVADTSAVLGSSLADQTFAPELRVSLAFRFMDLCWTPEARVALDGAWSRLDAQAVVLDTLAHSTDDALWTRLDRGDWLDAGLGAWMVLDTLVSRPTELARALTHAGERPEDAAIYRREAVAAGRRRLAEARAMLARARAQAGDAEARLAAEQLPDRGLACQMQRQRMFVVQGEFYCCGLPLMRDNYGPTRGELWSDEVGDQRFVGQSRCPAPRSPAEEACIRY